jgi:hypothetical protein
LELYEISLVFQPANQEAILLSAFEKSNSGKFIEILKSRHNKVAFYESELNNIWKLYNGIIDAIYEQSVADVVAKMETLSTEVLKFKELGSDANPNNLLVVLKDAINQAKSLIGKDEPNTRKILSAIMKLVSGIFMEWFVNAKYVIDKIKRGVKL